MARGRAGADMGVSDLLLPRLGETMEEGRVVLWLKAPGERYARGDTLLEVETDKTVVEVPALADGALVEILAEAGATVAVGALIARVESDAEATAPVRPAPRQPAPPAAEPARRPPPAAVAATDRAPHAASPRARAMARGAGVDLRGVTGTGRRGRIVAADLPPAAATTGGDERIATSGGALRLRRWPARGAVRGGVVLLHGLFDSADSWAGVAGVLARAGVEALAVDLPNHGRSDATATALEAVVGIVAEALAAAAPGPVALVGHSYGGAVAARLAADPALDVATLCLIAPVGLGDAFDRAFVDGMLAGPDREALRALQAMLSMAPSPRSDAALDAQAADLAARGPRLRAMIDDALRPGGGARLDGLAAPVCVVWGREDRVTPWTNALAAPPRTALHLAPGVGHAAHWEAPGLCAAVILDRLAQGAAQRQPTPT